MREIKFRAWDGISKKMWHNVTFDACHIYGEYSDELEGPNGTMPRWDTNPLMQFTGLCDKNGKEIWEGDIVRTRHYIGGNFIDYCINDGVIDWYKHAWRHNRNHKQSGWQYLWQCVDYEYEFEVIGNIWENGDLLK
jgi:uncharacterized phage protein (TIGR01671 family)